VAWATMAAGADGRPSRWRAGETCGASGQPIMPCGLTACELEAVAAALEQPPADRRALAQLAAVAALAGPPSGRQLPPAAPSYGLQISGAAAGGKIPSSLSEAPSPAVPLNWGMFPLAVTATPAAWKRLLQARSLRRLGLPSAAHSTTALMQAQAQQRRAAAAAAAAANAMLPHPVSPAAASSQLTAWQLWQASSMRPPAAPAGGSGSWRKKTCGGLA
jgi:hypothetical protein